MIEAYVFAGVGFAAMALYGYRSGTLLAEAGWDERLARLSFVLLLLFLGVSYLDIATEQTTLVWRQWLVGVGLLGVVVGQASLVRRDRH